MRDCNLFGEKLVALKRAVLIGNVTFLKVQVAIPLLDECEVDGVFWV